MLSDDISNQAISVTFHTAELTIDAIHSVLEAFLKDRQAKTAKPKVLTGEQEIKALYKTGAKLGDMPINEDEATKLRNEFEKTGVVFAISPTSAEDTYTLYFKAQDTGIIENAIKEVLKDTVKRPEKSLTDRMENAQQKAAEQIEQGQEGKQEKSRGPEK